MRLKADWFAATESGIHPQLYPAGTVLTGELLDRARALGLLEDAPVEAVAPTVVPAPVSKKGKR
jgi:uncharacterized protein YqgV (UPF0045/DUF77 family)